MKILLIQPPVILKKNEMPMVSPPLGLAYIAAVLKQHDYNVEIYDAVIQDPKGHDSHGEIHLGADWVAVNRFIVSSQPDVVGISSMFTSQADCAHRIARMVKDLNADTVTVMGGAHPSTLPHQVLEDNAVDYVVTGEGENTMLELIKSLEKKTGTDKINGIAFRQNGAVIIKPAAAPVSNLDAIPFPAWELLPMKAYAKLRMGHGLFIARPPIFSLITSRGCPGRCIFCSIHNISGSEWRARSAENVVDEIETLHKTYGINQFDFEDDNLVLSRDRMEAILDGIIARKLKIKWSTPNGVAINHIDLKLLPKMKKSGCFYLSFGIESGAEHIRNKIIKKPIAVGHAMDVIKICRKLNIWTHGFFILGIPGETADTFRETIDFAQKLGLDTASYFVATPYPGTELLDLCLEKGYLDRDFSFKKLRVADASIATERFTPQDLLEWRKRGYRQSGRHFMRRELLRLNFISRMLKIRSLDEARMYGRLGMRLIRAH